MTNTDKVSCRIIAQLLADHGVRHAVVCPGSRNAPLLLAFDRQSEIATTWVVDERSAAFIALGIATITGKPVAVVCTSGSAMLNFAPAVAEAYYRRVPLIVVSADRPAEWIDQDDSQTMRQLGALANIVKQSYDVPAETGDDTQRWLITRTVNDAMLMATASPSGPVHINAHIDVPLGSLSHDGIGAVNKIEAVIPERGLSVAQEKMLRDELEKSQRVLVIAGFMAPNDKVSEALRQLSRFSNVAIMQEAQANVKGGDGIVANIDSTLCRFDDEKKREMAPDLVITIGGSLVSRFVKGWLRGIVGLRHWHIGTQPYSVDCFKALSKRIEMDAADFLPKLVGIFPENVRSDYRAKWQTAAEQAREYTGSFLQNCCWSDFKAMGEVMSMIPENWNVQLSNGTTVRYAQLFPYAHIRRLDCNRGISGIDGCTSTAIGASMAYDGCTLLISGDMSAQYDMGALAASCISPRFKMAVLNNGGGGIFRFIPSTASLPDVDKYFVGDVRLPLRNLAEAYGFAYFEASSTEELATAWHDFASENQRPAILNMITPGEVSAELLREYMSLGGDVKK